MIEFLAGIFIGAPIGIIVICLLQVNHQPAGPVWHRTADRPPTAEDADNLGKVFAYHIKYGYETVRWSWVNLAPNDLTYWTRTPGDPPE